MANNTQDLIKGLLVASALGGASYLLSPKKEEACKKACDKDCKGACGKDCQCGCSHGSLAAGSFIAGAVVGGIAGLLLAPSSGEELRRDIGGTIGGTYDDVRSRAEKLLKDLNEKGSSFASDASDNVDEWKKSLSSLLSSLSGPEMKKQASNKFNEIAEWATLGLSVWEKLQKRK